MYSEEELEGAVSDGVLTQQQLLQLRDRQRRQTRTSLADREGFRLLTGFNDIFVTLACVMLMLSAGWLIAESSKFLALLVVAGLSWGLAETFVRQRNMALPAIVLLVSFLASTFCLPLAYFVTPSSSIILFSGLLVMLAAYAHWQRFAVPITLACTVVLGLVAAASLAAYTFPWLIDYAFEASLAAGALVFGLAMYWDSRDPARTTRRSDVAFWLHLLAAPLLVHPLFQKVGVISGEISVNMLLITLTLYLALAFFSLVIDRRALMVSAMGYVLYSFTQFLQTWSLNSSLAMTGVIVGGSLVILSVYWAPMRSLSLRALPQALRAKVPPVLLVP